MIISKTYIMLIVSAFTFFGLSALQNVSHFTDWFGDVKIVFNLTNEEEESEESSKEVKEVKEKLVSGAMQFSLQLMQLRSFGKWKIKSLLLDEGYFEIISPPPEN